MVGFRRPDVNVAVHIMYPDDVSKLFVAEVTHLEPFKMARVTSELHNYLMSSPTYLTQHYLQLPKLHFGRTCTVLPIPNVIDNWLDKNRSDALTNTLLPGYLFLTDTPNDQVLCTLQLSTVKVCR
jgi:hypothetical protein